MRLLTLTIALLALEPLASGIVKAMGSPDGGELKLLVERGGKVGQGNIGRSAITWLGP